LTLVGFVGGAFGAMVGLGGGIFVIPCLTLFLGIPIHTAIAASLIGVIATSTSGSITYLRQGFTNIRLAITLETALTLGAIAGGVVGAALGREALSAVFGVVMITISVYMAVKRNASVNGEPHEASLGMLGARYQEAVHGSEVRYRVRRLPLGLLSGLVAGHVSGLLGVGGGFLTVPTLHLGMGVPMRAAVATSNLMLGVTACAGAVSYLARGFVDPVVAVPVVLGVAAGALVGAKLGLRVKTGTLASVLAVVLFALALQMLLSAFGIRVR